MIMSSVSGRRAQNRWSRRYTFFICQENSVTHDSHPSLGGISHIQQTIIFYYLLVCKKVTIFSLSRMLKRLYLPKLNCSMFPLISFINITIDFFSYYYFSNTLHAQHIPSLPHLHLTIKQQKTNLFVPRQTSLAH